MFSPEIKGILADAKFSKKLNIVAMAEFIRFQQILGEKTWFESIKLLPPASVLTYDPYGRNISIWEYWDWRKLRLLSEDIDIREVALEAEIHELFTTKYGKAAGSGGGQ